jgi:hypothetical protein
MSKNKGKRKILLSLMFTMIFVIAFAFLNLVSYKISQGYASVAPDQLNEYTDAYAILKTQSNVSDLIDYSRGILFVLYSYIIVNVWRKGKPKPEPKEN